MRQLFSLISIFTFSVLFAISSHADVPTAEAKVHYKQPDDWVKIQPYDDTILNGQATGGPAYVLISRQRKLDDKDSYIYARFVHKLNDIQSIEDNSQLSFTFDPSYQELELHWVRVKRGDKITERLDASRVKILHTEDSADELIYNGDVSATFVLKDIQVGDVVDYAYSLKGKNPVFHGHITTGQRIGYSVPVGRQFIRFDMPDDRPYELKKYAGAADPQVTTNKGRREYVWDIPKSEGTSLDEHVPNWHVELPYAEITDMQSWQQLGAFYQPYYTVPQTISAALQSEIDKIAEAFQTDKQRARAALDFVQGNIRYLGIEMGAGGYAPRDPSLVLEQRFGDCKDKTMLLVTMLNRLGIEAHPTLVDTDYRDKFDEFLPTSGSFDHVITELVIDEKPYWVDPTKNQQLGDLDHLEQSALGKGLTINGDNSQIKDFPSQQAPELPAVSATEEFDLSANATDFDYKITTVYRGSEADKFIRSINKNGIDKQQRDYLNFYQETFANTSVHTPMSYTVNDVTGAVTVIEHYSVKDGWAVSDDETQRELELYPYYVRNIMPEGNTSSRKAPFKLSNLKYAEHTIKTQLDHTWSITAKNFEIDNPYFTFRKIEKFNTKNYVFSQTYSFILKKSFIPADEHQQYMKQLDKAWDEAGIYFTAPIEDKIVSNNLLTGTEWEHHYNTLVFIIIIVGIIILYLSINADKHRRKDTVFYPITIKKYLTMSLLTFGSYHLFWTFKNWQWVRDTDGGFVSPFWRTFFSVLMNFSLFIRISERKKSLSSLAIPFGVLYLGNQILDQFAERIWSADIPEFWWAAASVLFFPTILFYPFVAGVKALNTRQENALGYEAMLLNSKYTWSSWCAIVFGIHYIVFIIFGMYYT